MTGRRVKVAGSPVPATYQPPADGDNWYHGEWIPRTTSDANSEATDAAARR